MGNELARLSSTERGELRRQEAVIEQGLKTFVEVGTALRTIRDDKLYRETHATFEDYCRERWAIDRTYGHRLIDAAEIVGMLPMGNIRPDSERQARALAPLRDTPELMPGVMARARERGNGKLSARLIAEEVVSTFKADAAETRQAFRALWPPGFDPKADAKLTADRGRLKEVCLDIVALGTPKGFIRAQRGWLRPDHHAAARAAAKWLNEYVTLTESEAGDE